MPHPLHLYTVPLICYDSLKSVSIEVKLTASSCNTRMCCACMSELAELACMGVVITSETGKYSFPAFSYKASRGFIHAYIKLSCSEKLCFLGSQTRMHNACVSETMMKSVSQRWAPSLNDPSRLKGQCTDVKSGCVLSVGPSLNPYSLSFKKILVILSL